MNIYIISEKVKLDQAGNLVTNDNTAIIQLINFEFNITLITSSFYTGIKSFSFLCWTLDIVGSLRASSLVRCGWVERGRERELAIMSHKFEFLRPKSGHEMLIG